jgi:WS/DGAT/MGAT family acyltransferase
MWLQDSGRNLMLIQAVYILDRMNVETLRQVWQERVATAGGGERFPRFELKVVDHRGRWFWQRDAAFDLARHIVPCPVEGIHDQKQLQDYVGGLADQPLPADRPRWQLQVIEDFTEDSSVIVARLHHCMGDGIALIPVLFTLMDEASFPGADRLPSTAHAYSKVARALKAPLAGPVLLARKMLWRADRSAVHGSRLSGTKRVAWTEAIDFELVREVKVHLGVTVNDVLMACVAGAFQRYLKEVSGESVRTLRASMPFNVRSPNEPPKMENKFAAVLLELPMHIEDVRERVHEVRRRMNQLKQSVEPIVTYGLSVVLLKTLPLGISRRLIDFLANKCSAVVTNVPGPAHDLFIAGRRVRELVFWVPQRADIGIGISILSFAGTVRVGVYTDIELVPEPELLVAAFEEEFRVLSGSLERPF